MRRRDHRLKYLILGLFAAVGSLTFLIGHLRSDEVDAASLANFDPGFIISDYTMSNYNSMTQAEIQAFLTSKNPCNNRDYSYYQALSASNPNVQWHWKDGHFVCISEELFGDGMVIGEGKTAAQIIYETAQEYKINPQVLLVLIQKESSLITDPIPNNYDYRTMTGFGCPDTAPCDAKYFGFKNQIRKAAWLFREVLDGGWTNYPLGENYVQYNPNAGCGGSIVNIRSLATSALYRYTPYQPNAGAIAAGYGTAYCGAYGNRNFYLYFEDWFGGITDDFNINSLESARIPDGTYSIANVGSGKLIDINGGTKSATAGTTVHAWNSNGTDAQKWKVSNNSDGTFTIINPALGLVLDGDNGLTIEENRNQCSQKWKILKYDNDYIISTTCSGAVLQNNSLNSESIIVGSAIKGNTIKWRINLIDINLEEGEYIIKSALDNNKGLNISTSEGLATKGSNVELATFVKGKEQAWKIVKNDDNTYSFYDSDSGLVMDVDGGSTKKGANIRMWSGNGSCAQKWKIAQNNDSYVFISVCSDLVMDVDGGIPNENTNVHLWWFNNTFAQKWQIEKIERQAPIDNAALTDGKYIIKSKIDTNKTIDIDGGAETASNGNNIQLWRNNGTNAQIWNVTHNESDDTYSIINDYNGKAIDVDGAQTVRGTNIQLWNSNYTCAQKWRVTKEEEEYITLTSACSELVLDVSGGKADLGANINLWTANGTDAQKWFFEPINR